MAARIDTAAAAFPGHLLDLRQVKSRQLAELLDEEVAAWQRSLIWDFAKSADLVRRFVELRALSGCAILERNEIAGYGYYVLDQHKGLIGDLYVRSSVRTVEKEMRLLEWVVAAMISAPQVQRIEAQLMLLDSPAPQKMPLGEYLRTFERIFMVVDLETTRLAEAPVRRPVYLEKWTEHYQDAAAQLIAQSYAGHVDGLINDQYRTPEGARRFLYNVVTFPGCGAFCKPASWTAFDGVTGRMCGVALASLVSAGCGHITQLCVAPEVQGSGVGYLLLRQALTALRGLGCHSASLTVTASNQGAVGLYQRAGFEVLRRFQAYVWEGF
jgi:ribosomal protein S18 acetylase RimI-like enzyme